ncbi:hypothetical protein GmHk_05G014218 [Glycine max]|nr:hypothetical protein GmHk_05G014218 [Glycine max]
MILGPGFIPPTQLLFSIPFSFFLSIFISFLHALMVRLSLAFIFLSICTHNNNNNKKVLFTVCFCRVRIFNSLVAILFCKGCIFITFVYITRVNMLPSPKSQARTLVMNESICLHIEMTVMSVEGMHSLDAEVADAYTCEREMK